MTVTALPAMLPALPEMFLAVAGMGLLVYGVFTHRGGAQPLTSWGTVVAFVVAARTRMREEMPRQGSQDFSSRQESQTI